MLIKCPSHPCPPVTQVLFLENINVTILHVCDHTLLFQVQSGSKHHRVLTVRKAPLGGIRICILTPSKGIQIHIKVWEALLPNFIQIQTLANTLHILFILKCKTKQMAACYAHTVHLLFLPDSTLGRSFSISALQSLNVVWMYSNLTLSYLWKCRFPSFGSDKQCHNECPCTYVIFRCVHSIQRINP